MPYICKLSDTTDKYGAQDMKHTQQYYGQMWSAHTTDKSGVKCNILQTNMEQIYAFNGRFGVSP